MNEEMVALDRFVKEGEQIQETLHTCEMSIDYLELAEDLIGVRETLVPGQLGSKNPKAVDLEQQLMDLEQQLKEHFICEEDSVIKAFNTWGMPELIIEVEETITEHEEILRKLSELRKEASELFIFELGINPWHDNAWLIRRKLLELSRVIKSHAGKEESIYKEAQKMLEQKNLIKYKLQGKS
jgi:hypothetical protein